MANPVIADLANQVTSTVGVMQSAEVLINGFAGRMQTAVDQALANGATAEELKPVTDEIAALQSGSSTLAAAVVANSPVPVDPNPPPTPPLESGRRNK